MILRLIRLIISRVAIPINLLRPFITFYFLYEICYIFPEYLARKNLRRTNNIILIRKNLPLRWNLTLHCWTLPKHESEPCVIDESLYYNAKFVTNNSNYCQNMSKDSNCAKVCKMRNAKIKKSITFFFLDF